MLSPLKMPKNLLGELSGLIAILFLDPCLDLHYFMEFYTKINKSRKIFQK